MALVGIDSQSEICCNSTQKQGFRENVASGSVSARLARLLHPVGTTRRLLASINFTGYFDEGGTHYDSRMIVVAGYVSPERRWRRLEFYWKQILKREGVVAYHATDLEANPPRDIYKGWSRQRADALADQFLPLIEEYAQTGFGVSIATKAWLSAARFIRELAPQKPHFLPFQILMKGIIEAIIDSFDETLPSHESVGFVFEDNDFSGAALEGYQVLRRQHPHAHRLGGIVFEPKVKWAALQAADMLAWHYRRTKEIQLGVQYPLHRHTPRLILPEPKCLFLFLTEEQLRERTEDALASVIGRS